VGPLPLQAQRIDEMATAASVIEYFFIGNFNILKIKHYCIQYTSIHYVFIPLNIKGIIKYLEIKRNLSTVLIMY